MGARFGTDLASTRCHLDAALRVCFQALLAVVYDDIMRKDWEEKSTNLGHQFHVGSQMGKQQDDALRRAKVAHLVTTVAVYCIACVLHVAGQAVYDELFSGSTASHPTM